MVVAAVDALRLSTASGRREPGSRATRGIARRPGFLLTYGYIAFLASWLARHNPWKVTLAALALSAISISGDSLQIDSGLPAATVNILMALLLLAVFGIAGKRKAVA